MPTPASRPADVTRSGRRWLVLGIGVFAQTATFAFAYGMPFLVPVLRDTYRLSLSEVGTYVAAPTAGLLVALVAWGAAADRWGERIVMTIGLSVTALVVGATALLPHLGHGQLVGLLVLGGAGSASVSAASGRLVMGWFARTERGLAMGIRQTSQPLGVAVAGVSLPALAGSGDPFGALLFPAALCLLAAVLVATLAPDPPREPAAQGSERPRSPYRTTVLWRVHTASAMLVVPQFAISAFGTEYLVREQGWAVAAAGGFVAAVGIVGALGRIGTGVWSDRVGSRLRPMRHVAAGAAVVLVVFALGDALAGWLAVVALALGAVVTVAPNGLAFTATAEIAGSAWSGRALGIQNTGQNIVASAVPVALGTLVGAAGYSTAFLIAALAPLAAVALVPVRQEPAARW